MSYTAKSPEERFWRHVNKNGPNGCWEWTGGITAYGYGRFMLKKGTTDILAHRMSVILDGRDPTDLHVCHKCDNTKCVNPGHLFIGTAKDNAVDRMHKDRSAKHMFKHRKLTDDEVREIRTSSLSQRKLESKYGVSKSSIAKIIHRKTYTEVT